MSTSGRRAAEQEPIARVLPMLSVPHLDREFDYLVPAEDAGKKERIIRHTSINKAKGLDAIGVIMVGLPPFPQLTHPDQQFAYFMGASRAKQLLAVIHG